MSASKLMKALKPSSKIASALDWKKASGSILTMDISSKSIAVCIAAHPLFGEAPKPLESIPIKLETRECKNKRGLSKETISELQEIVKSFNVSSFVVNWPIEAEGRAGFAAGKTLHTLEALLEDSSTVINQNRPFCLHDKNGFKDQTDAWGRNSIYGEVPPADKTIHIASQEQYKHDATSSTAVQVWNDFCMKQWPEIYQQQPQQMPCIVGEEPAEVEVEWLEHYEDTEAYVSMAA